MLYSRTDMGFDSRIMLTEKRVRALPVRIDTDQAGESPARHFEVSFGRYSAHFIYLNCIQVNKNIL